jgi:hypothetical protein
VSASGFLFDAFVPEERAPLRRYSGILTVTQNGKGCVDVDTVKGCARGMAAYPDGGCYGECYAAKTAARYGIDFTTSVSRRIHGREHRGTLIRIMNGLPVSWAPRAIPATTGRVPFRACARCATPRRLR